MGKQPTKPNKPSTPNIKPSRPQQPITPSPGKTERKHGIGRPPTTKSPKK